jgi:hypothetical protein
VRKVMIMFLSTASVVVASLGFGTASAAASDVLTVGSVGGTNVAVSDTLTAPTIGNEVFASGFESITCTGGGLTGTVSSNPTAAGTATITGTGLKFTPTNPGTCNSNLGVATVSGGPAGSLSVSSAKVVTVNSIGLSFTAGGTSCSYKVTSPQTGAASNVDNSIGFTGITITKTAGGALCSSTLTETLNFAPVTDTTQSGQKVFVN